MGNFGIKIMREGKSVSSTDIRDYILHSKYKTLKSQERVNATLTLPANTLSAVATIPHNLGYVPFFFATMEVNPNKWYNLRCTQTVIIDENTNYAYSPFAWADSTNLYIQIERPTIYIGSNPFTVSKDYDYSYYIIIDEVA